MAGAEPPDPRAASVRRGKRGRIELTLDDGRVFNFGDEAWRRSGLREGGAVPAEVLERLDADDRRARVHEAALHLLSYRPRSEAELRRRLRERADEETVEEEIDRLRAAGLIDDSAFAAQWVEERQERAPRSGRLLRQELRGKGIDGETAFAATAGLDDNEAALAFASARARRFTGDFDDFAAKTSAALQRRGFGYATAEAAIRRAWAESRDEGRGLRTED